MGVHEHKAHSKADKLIAAIDRLTNELMLHRQPVSEKSIQTSDKETPK